MENLGSFSHVWLLWVFHQNPENCSVKAKVSPPRLDGQRVGVFSSRSPHRPANIGLSLVRLDSVMGATLQLVHPPQFAHGCTRLMAWAQGATRAG